MIFGKLTERLIEKGLICKEGTIVDATIIARPQVYSSKGGFFMQSCKLP